MANWEQYQQPIPNVLAGEHSRPLSEGPPYPGPVYPAGSLALFAFRPQLQEHPGRPGHHRKPGRQLSGDCCVHL